MPWYSYATSLARLHLPFRGLGPIIALMDAPANFDKNTPVVTSKEKSSVGALVTLFIVIAVIVIGALYVWGERVAEKQEVVPAGEAL